VDDDEGDVFEIGGGKTWEGIEEESGESNARDPRGGCWWTLVVAIGKTGGRRDGRVPALARDRAAV